MVSVPTESQRVNCLIGPPGFALHVHIPFIPFRGGIADPPAVGAEDGRSSKRGVVLLPEPSLHKNTLLVFTEGHVCQPLAVRAEERRLWHNAVILFGTWPIIHNHDGFSAGERGKGKTLTVGTENQ